MDSLKPESSAHLLRLMVDQVPSMLAYWGADLRCRFANQAYAVWLGVDPNALVGQSVESLLGPELFALNEPYIRAALGGQLQCFEREIPGPGGVRHSLSHYIPDVVDGQVVGFTALVTDVGLLKQAQDGLRATVTALKAEIAQRRSAERALGDARQGLALALASIEAGFISADRHGCVTNLNSVAEEVTGWTRAEALGQSLWRVFEREDRPQRMQNQNPVDLMVALGTTAQTVHRVVAVGRGGRRTPVEMRAALTFGQDSKPDGLAMVFRDMTRLHAAEADSRRLAAIVESSHDAIISKTLDGRITSWNTAAQTLFGYSAEEAIGQPIQMLIPPERLSEEMHILTELAQGIHIPAFDTQRRTKDGHLVDLSLAISPVRDAIGRIIGASKIARDIGAQKAAEQARITAQRLEAENQQIQESNRLKSQFLANMSHELRTPLNAIIGFADLLHAGAVPADAPKHQIFLGHIGTSGRHLLQLINDLLDLSKVESGKFEFYPEPVDLKQLFAEVTDILRPSIERKHLRLRTEVAPGLTDLVLDPARLKQVLYNYLSNAIKFTPERGQLVLRAQPEGATHLRLEVQDSGIGISQADLPRLFSEFQQLDSGHDKRHEGTGLGLALTCRLVQAQGGTVGVRSELGRGSVFHAVLNRVHGTDAMPVWQPPSRGPHGPTQRMLVIEGNPALQGAMTRGLNEAGFHVDAAASGEQAVARAHGTPYDAMTLGLQLPDASGLSVLGQLRGQGQSRGTPVVGLSVPSGAGDVASFAIANVLRKPIHTAEVVAAMALLKPARPGPAKVMVIDDDPRALDLMKATLDAVGVKAVCLLDGRQALAQLDQQAPDAIILDLMMPGLDGFAVLDALRQRPAWRDTPVYIWTNMILSDAEYANLSRSANAIVSKGGGALADLLEALRRRRPGAAPALPTPAVAGLP